MKYWKGILDLYSKLVRWCCQNLLIFTHVLLALLSCQLKFHHPLLFIYNFSHQIHHLPLRTSIVSKFATSNKLIVSIYSLKYSVFLAGGISRFPRKCGSLKQQSAMILCFLAPTTSLADKYGNSTLILALLRNFNKSKKQEKISHGIDLKLKQAVTFSRICR